MKWLKKVAATPLTSIAKVIDGFNGANKNTNAPSIRAVEEALDAKASNDDLTAATMELNAAIAEKADTNAMFLERTYNFTYELEAGELLLISASDFGITAISGYTPIAFSKIDNGSRYINLVSFHARTNATIIQIRNTYTAAVSNTVSITMLFVRNELIGE